jgi:hypothetical protein
MNTIDEAIAILEAIKEGKEIQFMGGYTWLDWNIDGIPNFLEREYRIKPKPRTFWANVYPDQVTSCLYRAKRDAETYCGQNGETIKVVEVIE